MASLFPTEAEIDGLLVGPDSVAWQIASDVRLNLVMLYPLLLQVAHPTVSAGVRDYSDFEKRPWERLARTFTYLTVLVYGGRDAVAAGRRLRRMHARFRGVRDDGAPYHALEPDAYAWVHATLLAAYLAGHAHFGRYLSEDEVERFYREYRGLGRLIGMRENDLPPDYDGFRAYFDRTQRTVLARTSSVDRVLRAVRSAGPPPIRLPRLAWRAVTIGPRRAVWLSGIGLFAPEVREQLGLPWSARAELEFRALGALCRRAGPFMPESLRVTAQSQRARPREAPARGPEASDPGVIASALRGA